MVIQYSIFVHYCVLDPFQVDMFNNYQVITHKWIIQRLRLPLIMVCFPVILFGMKWSQFYLFRFEKIALLVYGPWWWAMGKAHIQLLPHILKCKAAEKFDKVSVKLLLLVSEDLHSLGIIRVLTWMQIVSIMKSSTYRCWFGNGNLSFWTYQNLSCLSSLQSMLF